MLLNFFLWISVNPNPIAFKIPFLNHPIAWYGIIFSAAFYIGYKIFIWIYSRELLKNITISEKYAKEDPPNYFLLSKKQEKLFKFVEKRTSEKEFLSVIKKQFYLEGKYQKILPSISSLALKFADSALIYMIIATIFGARIFHILFYESISQYLYSPLLIIKTWEGGLASHGGIIAIVFASFLFIKKQKEISYLFFMDLVSIPTMFVCAFIRIGNFINQEILGAASTLPWAIVFKNPADGEGVFPRHPMPIYEFILYIGVFIFLFHLWQKNFFKKQEGLLFSLALIISFSVRFFLEFLKVPQSVYDGNFSLQMGQFLSIPMVLFGAFLLFQSRKEKLYPRQKNFNKLN